MQRLGSGGNLRFKMSRTVSAGESTYFHEALTNALKYDSGGSVTIIGPGMPHVTLPAFRPVGAVRHRRGDPHLAQGRAPACPHPHPRRWLRLRLRLRWTLRSIQGRGRRRCLQTTSDKTRPELGPQSPLQFA